jgi:hypothetical protein
MGDAPQTTHSRFHTFPIVVIDNLSIWCLLFVAQVVAEPKPPKKFGPVLPDFVSKPFGIGH